MRCDNCNKKFTKVYFTDKHCSSEQCKESKYEYQNGKRESSTFNKPKKEINKRSEKRKSEEQIYSVLSKDYKKNNPICQRCKKSNTEDVHHRNGREGKRLNLIQFWMPACRKCHDYIHNNPEESYIKGWLIKQDIDEIR